MYINTDIEYFMNYSEGLIVNENQTIFYNFGVIKNNSRKYSIMPQLLKDSKNLKWLIGIFLPIISVLSVYGIFHLMTLSKGMAEMIVWLSLVVLPFMAIIGLILSITSFIFKKFKTYTLSIAFSLWIFVGLFIYFVWFT